MRLAHPLVSEGIGCDTQRSGQPPRFGGAVRWVGALITAGLLVSIFGALNSQSLLGTRVSLAVGQRRELPGWRVLGAVNRSFQTPIDSLVFQGLIGIVFVMFGSKRHREHQAELGPLGRARLARSECLQRGC